MMKIPHTREGKKMAPDETQSEELAPIAEETAQDQRVIPFEGDDLAAAMTASGDIYISVGGMCAALGLTPRSQFNRIQRTMSLARGLRRIPLETKGGIQRVNCLRLDRVALWVAGIETARLKPKIAMKIDAYQEELAPVAMRVFMHSLNMTIPASAMTDPRLAALAEQYDTLIDVAGFLREHMTMIAAIPGQLDTMSMQLEQAVTLLESLAQRQDETDHTVAKIEARTQGLTAAQQAKVREAVEIITRDSAGLHSALDFAQVYAALKRRFQVGSYKQIPDSRYDEVMSYLRDMWRQATSGAHPEQGAIF